MTSEQNFFVKLNDFLEISPNRCKRFHHTFRLITKNLSIILRRDYASRQKSVLFEGALSLMFHAIHIQNYIVFNYLLPCSALIFINFLVGCVENAVIL